MVTPEDSFRLAIVFSLLKNLEIPVLPLVIVFYASELASWGARF